MIARLVIARVVIAASLLSATLADARPADEVSIDQALALFRARSPRLAAARTAVDVARADVVDARIHPNPELGLSTSRTAIGDTAGPGSQYMVDVSIPVLIGRQRSRRMAAATARVGAASAEVALIQADAELEIRSRFAALLAAQEQTSVLEAALADARSLRVIVAGRSTAGASSPYAVERIDLAIATLASRVDAATADEVAASGDLAVAVGVPDWHPRATGVLTRIAGIDTPSVEPTHPALVFDRAVQAATRADVARARAAGIPTPSVAVQADRTTAPNGVALTFGVSVPLALFDRNQGDVARTRAEARRADRELAAKTTELATELERARRVAAARTEALARFQGDGLQRLATVRAMAEASYRNGQGGIVELLDALDAITEARLRDIELRVAVVAAELDLRRAAAGR